MKESNEKVTIKLVAERAGVCVATAARVMGGYGSVSERTRDKVLKASEELLYMPDAIAKSMRKKKTSTIGIVVGDIQAPFFSKLIFNVENSVSKLGYNVLICNTNENPKKEVDAIKSLLERRVDGIIVSPAQNYNFPVSQEARNYYEGDIPIVMIDRFLENVSCPVISSDNYMGSYQGTKYLLDLGHRKIGVFVPNMNISSNHDRLEGFKAALEEYNIPFDPTLISYSESGHVVEDARAEIYSFLMMHPEVTALYALNHPAYKASWAVLNSMGRRVPEDISILGWGDSELAEAWQMTVITQPLKEMAVCAANMLVAMIEGQKDAFPEKPLIFKTELNIRRSCKKI